MGRSIRFKSLEWLGIWYVELYDEGFVQILQGFGGLHWVAYIFLSFRRIPI
jgi:hypothetical protein